MKRLAAHGPGGPEVLRLEQAVTPVPGDGQALIRVAYAALNPLDVLVRQGRVNWMADGWPFTPGLEFGGVVQSVAPGVDSGWIGRKVVSFSQFGGCAEFAVAPVDRLLPLTAELGWKTAIAWRTPTLTAWHLLNDAANLQKGETVLIHSAAGPVGIMASQIARELGGKVIGLAGGPAKVSFAQGYGTDTVFDYRTSDWPELVARQTNGLGVDLVIDGNGGPNAVRNYELIVPNGRVFHIGATSGMAAPQVAPSLLIAKSFSVGGFNLNSIPDNALDATAAYAASRLARGAWRFPLGETAPLEEGAALHAKFEAREITGRAMFEIGGEL